MKITSSLIEETDYFREEDESFCNFDNGFRFIFNYEEIFNTIIEIRNPFVHSKIKWQEFYDHIEEGNNYKLDFGELGHLEYSDNKLHYKVGNNKEYYQFKYSYGRDFDNKCFVTIPLAQYKQDFLLALKSLLDDQEIIKGWK